MDRHSDKPVLAPTHSSVPTISRRRFLQGTVGVTVLYLAPIAIDIAQQPRNLIRVTSDANIIVLTKKR